MWNRVLAESPQIHNSGVRPERMSARDNATRDRQAVLIVDKSCAEIAAGKRPQFSPTLEVALARRARVKWQRGNEIGAEFY